MTSPHHLHAVAAAWSLQAAHDRLTTLADEEAAQIAAGHLEAPALLRSPVYGSRHASGGHGDPTPSMVAVDDRPARRNRWAEMDRRLDGRLRWLAEMLRWRGGDPLSRIRATIPEVQPGTAATIARHLTDEDTWVRAAVGLSPERQPVPGAPACPGCDLRRLEVWPVGPVDAWTVICAAGCRCGGHGCGCGMPGAVEGAPHIWPRALVLGAVTGAAPTN